MRTYIFEKELTIRAPVEEVWRFFSDPLNLARISPEYMNFRIVHCPETEEIYDGMQIEYRVSPVLKIPLKWVTEIKEVRPHSCFTDTQLTGPYALWEHTHIFSKVSGGTHMHDRVKYALPFGPVGSLAHSLFVRRQLQGIFVYRESMIDGLFEQAGQQDQAVSGSRR